MERPDDTRYDAVSSHKQTSSGVTYDSRWPKDLRSAIRCSAVVLCLLQLIDWWAGSFTAARATLWVALGVLLFVILYPARVTAGEGWLASRGLVRERRVRTDALVSARCLGGVSQRLRLRDASGGRLEINPQVLHSNPELWHRFAKDANAAAARGHLTCGATALRRISARIDRETALTVFKDSGLD
ncbi:hypothetical protein OG758_10830 [Streptomyces sp. NBC_01474]|uniref:hypothetical protein n=1 Tax=unclassified Streptomyces TaxID=2593676 RepID=UPI002DDC2573|nr:MULTISPECIES: hypothetical protein [unclassified Streptomyces]WSD94608.1 hypothetical protein OG758_10830 [Streptomyces sp. NBC_01474]